MPTPQPVGTMKKIVSLVDRGAFDNIVYPQDATDTRFQPEFKPYHNFVPDITTWPFTGVAEWGKRLTFTVPQPFEVDMLSWIALRLKPFHWLSHDVYRHLYEIQDWTYTNPAGEWIWANSIGTIAIERAEMEVDGVIVEQWSGDWCDIWTKSALDMSKAIGWDDSVVGGLDGTAEGYIYCYLPFWFAKTRNLSYPLVSSKGPVRFHITLRPFHQVVRKRGEDKACEETPLGSSFQIRNWSVPFLQKITVEVGGAIPTMESAELVCGVAQIDGEIRKAFRESPHEVLMNPVQELTFSEPLKYQVGVANGDIIQIGLPLTELNGPIRQIFWFLRRKAAIQTRSDWTNYSAVLEGEYNATFNTKRPLLRRAQLLIGTAVWADEEEAWWRTSGALPLDGGIRVSGNYVYCYNFTEKPNSWEPAGTLNASRVDIRLNLEVHQPSGSTDKEWEVVVFAVGTNWMRFQNGLANQLFMD
jgi:hypothetical protein